MQVWIGIHLPYLALESFRPSWSKPASDTGLVVMEKDRAFGLDATARSLGISHGMRRGGVITLAPDIVLHERNAVREQEIVHGVAFTVLQFSPLVTLGDEDIVLVNVASSLRLFGGIRALRRKLRASIATFGVTAAIGIAPTGGAAWLLARIGGGVALSPESFGRAQVRIPLLALPAARRFSDWFEGLGCSTLADLQRLPRAGLKKRCGTALLDAADQAAGTAPEVHEWLQPPPAFDVRLELPDRIEHAEAVLFSARRLLLQMTGWLCARQLAIARFVLLLEHERGRAAIAPTEIDIALGEPASREEHLVRLLKERLARTELAAAVIAVRLVARDVREAAAPSESLLPEPGGTPQDHARLMELLATRLGAENVLRAAPVADHRPEVAARWLPATPGKTEKTPPAPADLPRPAWLLEKPVQLMTRGHRPFYGSPLRLVSPGERIESGWQDGATVTRDYFVAESDDRVHYWIFRERVSSRDAEDPCWFLHGLFG